MPHAQAVFGDATGDGIVTKLYQNKSARSKLVISHDTQMTAEEPFNIINMGPKRDVVVC